MSITAAIITAGAVRDTTNDTIVISSDVDSNGTIDGETIIIRGSSGRLRAGTDTLTIRESSIRIVNNSHPDPLVYGVRSDSKNIDLDNSIILANTTARKNIRLRHIRRTVIAETEEVKNLFVYTRGGAILDNALFKGVSVWEIYRAPAQVSNVVVDNCGAGFLNWEAGRLTFIGFDVRNMTLAAPHGWFGTANSGNNTLFNWNKGPGFDSSKIRFQHNSNQYLEGYTVAWRFEDPSRNRLENVKVRYSNDDALLGTQALKGEYITNSDGVLRGTWDTRQQSFQTEQDFPVLFVLTGRSDITLNGTLPSVVLDGGDQLSYNIIAITSQFEVRSYGHLTPQVHQPNQVFSLTSPIGAVDGTGAATEVARVELLVDPGITETKATVDAYTELDTAEKLYHRMVSEWYDEGHPRPNWEDEKIVSNDQSIVFLDPTSAGYAAADTIAYASNTGWTVKAGATFTGNIDVGNSNTVTLNGIRVVGTIVDSTQDSLMRFNIPAGYNSSFSIYSTAAAADAGGTTSRLAQDVSEWRYNSSTYQGTTVWLRILPTVGDGELVVGITVPQGAGTYNEDVIVSAANVERAQILSAVTDIRNVVQDRTARITANEAILQQMGMALQTLIQGQQQQAAPGSGYPTSSSIASAVWNAELANYTGIGSAASIISNVDSATRQVLPYTWGSGVAVPTNERAPRDITVDGDGNITMVGATTDSVFTYSNGSWNTGSSLPSALTNPRGLAYEGNGNIWVSDATTNMVYRYDSSTSSWDAGIAVPNNTRSTSPLLGGGTLAYYNGVLFLVAYSSTDTSNSNQAIYSYANGSWDTGISGPPNTTLIEGIAFLNGNMIIVDGTSNSLYQRTVVGQNLVAWDELFDIPDDTSFPAGIATNGDAVIVLATDTVANEQLIYTAVEPDPITSIEQLVNTTYGLSALNTNIGNVVDQVWDEALADHATTGTTGAKLSDINAGGASGQATLTAAEISSIADAVWDEGLSDHSTAGSAGQVIQETSNALKPLFVYDWSDTTISTPALETNPRDIDVKDNGDIVLVGTATNAFWTYSNGRWTHTAGPTATGSNFQGIAWSSVNGNDQIIVADSQRNRLSTYYSGSWLSTHIIPPNNTRTDALFGGITQSDQGLHILSRSEATGSAYKIYTYSNNTWDAGIDGPPGTSDIRSLSILDGNLIAIDGMTNQFYMRINDSWSDGVDLHSSATSQNGIAAINSDVNDDDATIYTFGANQEIYSGTRTRALSIAAPIADAVWDEAIADHSTADTTGKKLTDIQLGLPAAADIADAVWDEVLADHNNADSTGNRFLSLPRTVTDISTAVWNRGLSGFATAAGTIGKKIHDLQLNLPTTTPTVPTAADIADAVWDEALADHSTADTTGKKLTDLQLNLPTTAPTIPTAADIADAVWDEALADHTTADTIGKKVSDLQLGLPTTSPTVPTVDQIADAVWDEVITGHTTTDTTGKKLTDLINGPAASAIADAVWDEAIGDHNTAGTVGEKLTDIPTTVASTLTAADVADAVWDEALTGHATAGSAGATLEANRAGIYFEADYGWDTGFAIAPSESGPQDIAYDNDGNLLLVGWDEDTVFKYENGAWDSGTSTPSAVTSAQGIAVDSNGNWTLGNSGTNQYFRYVNGAWSQTAIAAPSGSASGGLTGGISYDDDDNLWAIVSENTSNRWHKIFMYNTSTSTWSGPFDGPDGIEGGMEGIANQGDDILVVASNTQKVYRRKNGVWDDGFDLPDAVSGGNMGIAVNGDEISVVARSTSRIYTATRSVSVSIARHLVSPTYGLETIKSTIDALPTAADITDAVWDEDLADHVAADSIGKKVSDLQLGLPTTDAPTVDAIADAVWDEVITGHTTTDTTGKKLTDLQLNLPTSATSAPTVAQIADAVWDEALSGHNTTGTAGKKVSDIQLGLPTTSPTVPTVAQIADAVWDEVLSGHNTTGTTGEKLTDLQLNLPTTATSAPSTADITSAIWGADLTDYTTAGTTGKKVADLQLNLPTTIPAAPSVPTAASIADAVWDEVYSDHTTADTFGDFMYQIHDAVGQEEKYTWTRDLVPPTAETEATDIAVKPNGDVVLVGSATNKVYTFSNGAWDTGIDGPATATSLQGIALSGDDYWVVDSGTNHIFRYVGTDGTWTAGGNGPNDGRTGSLFGGITTDDNNVVYVLAYDQSSGTSAKIYSSSSGTWSAGIDGPTGLSNLQGIGFLNGNLIVIDSDTNKFYSRQNGTWDNGVDIPSGLNGYAIAAYGNNVSILVQDPNNSNARSVYRGSNTVNLALIKRLTNSTYGLPAIRSAIDTIDSTVNSIPDLVWDETLADHATAGSAGKRLTDIPLTGGGGGGQTALTQTAFNSLMAGVPSGTKDDFKATIPTIPSTSQIADAVWDEVLADHTTANTIGRKISDLQLGLPTTSPTVPTVAQIADAVWDEALSGHATAGTSGKKLTDLQLGLPTSNPTVPTVAQIADAVWDEAIGDHNTTGTVGEKLTDIPTTAASTLTAAAIADAVLDESVADHTTAGSLGEQIRSIQLSIGEQDDYDWNFDLLPPEGETGVTDISVKSNGDILLVGVSTNKVYTFSNGMWDEGIDPPSGVTNIQGVAADGNNIWIADAETNHFFYLTKTNRTQSWGSGINGPNDSRTDSLFGGIAVDDDGNLNALVYIGGSGTASAIYKYENSTWDGGLPGPTGATHKQGIGFLNGNLIVIDSNNGRFWTYEDGSWDSGTPLPAGVRGYGIASLGTDIYLLMRDVNDNNRRKIWKGSKRINLLAVNRLLGSTSGLTGIRTAVDMITDKTLNAELSSYSTDGTIGKKLADIPLGDSIADSVWDEALADHVAANSVGKKVSDLQLGLPTTSPTVPSAADIADAVWDEALADHVAADSIGKKISDLQLGLPTTSPTIPSAADVADAVWSEALSGYTTAGTAGKQLSDIPLTGGGGSNTALTQTAFDALMAGVPDATKNTYKATVSTPPTAAAIADAVWDETLADHATAGTTGKKVTDLQLNLPAANAIAIAVWGANITDNNSDSGSFGQKFHNLPEASNIADAVWNEALSSFTTAGSAGKKLTDLQLGLPTTSAPTAASIADAVWDEALSDHTTAGTIGEKIDDLQLGLPTSSPTIPTVGQIADAVWDEALGDHVAADTVGKKISDLPTSLTGTATISTSTISDIADAVWDEGLSDHSTAGSAGKKVSDLQLGLPTSNPTIPSAADIADAVWDEGLNGHSTAGTAGKKLDDLQLGLSTRTPPNAATIADAVWNEALSSFTTAGTAGKKLTDIQLGLPTSNPTVPTVSQIADAVWDEALTDHSTAGTAGKKLTDIPLTSSSGTALTQTEFDTFMAAVPGATKNTYKATIPTTLPTTTSIAAAVWNELYDWRYYIAPPTAETSPTDISIGANGQILLVGTATNKVYTYSGGSWDAGIDGPSEATSLRGVAADVVETDFFFVTDSVLNQLFFYNTSTSRWSPGIAMPSGTTLYPAGIVLNPTGYAQVAVSVGSSGTLDKIYSFDGGGWVEEDYSAPTGIADIKGIDLFRGDLILISSSTGKFYTHVDGQWDAGDDIQNGLNGYAISSRGTELTILAQDTNDNNAYKIYTGSDTRQMSFDAFMSAVPDATKNTFKGSSLTAASIADAVWDEDLADHVAADSIGKKISDLQLSLPTASAIAEAVWGADISANSSDVGSFGNKYQSLPLTGTIVTNVWGALLTDHNADSGSFGEKIYGIPTTSPTVPSVADIADAVWDEALSGHATAGTAGKKITDIPTTATLDSNAIASAVWEADISDHNSDSGSFGNKFQSLPLTTTIVENVWGELISDHNADIGTFGWKFDRLPTTAPLTGAAIASAVWASEVGDYNADVGTFGNKFESLPTEPAIRAAVWEADVADYATDSGSTGQKLGQLTNPTIPTISDIAAAVWNAALTDHTTVGSAGKKLTDTPTTTGGGSVSINATDINNIADAVWDELLADHAIENSIGKKIADLQVPTVQAIADSVWDEVLNDHAVENSAGKKLTDIPLTLLQRNFDSLMSNVPLETKNMFKATSVSAVEGGTIGSNANTNLISNILDNIRSLSYQWNSGTMFPDLPDAGGPWDIEEGTIINGANKIIVATDTTATGVGHQLFTLTDGVWDNGLPIANLSANSTVVGLTANERAIKLIANDANLDANIYQYSITDEAWRSVIPGPENTVPKAIAVLPNDNFVISVEGSRTLYHYNVDTLAWAIHTTLPATFTNGAHMLTASITGDLYASEETTRKIHRYSAGIWNTETIDYPTPDYINGLGIIREHAYDRVVTIQTTGNNNADDIYFERFADTTSSRVATAEQLADAVWDEVITDHSTVGTTGAKLTDLQLGLPTAAAITDAVWDEDLTGHATAGSTGAKLTDLINGPTTSDIADAVWDESLTDHTTAGTIGEKIDDLQLNLPTTADIPTAASIADAVWDETLADHTTTDTIGKKISDLQLGLPTTIPTAPTAASIADAVWDETLADHTTAGTIGEKIDDLQLSLPTSVPTAASVADAVWSEALADHSTAGSTGKKLTDLQLGLPTSNPTIPTIPTAAAIADAVWDEALADHTTADTTGAKLTDIQLGLPTSNPTIPSATDIADAVWDEQLADHATVGSAGKKLTDNT